jgi:hypothetical protein
MGVTLSYLMLNLWKIFRKSQGLRTKLPIALNQFQILLWFWCFVIVFSVFYLLIIMLRIIYPFFTPTLRKIPRLKLQCCLVPICPGAEVSSIQIGVPGENHWPVANHWITLSHNVASSIPHQLSSWLKPVLKVAYMGVKGSLLFYRGIS